MVANLQKKVLAISLNSAQLRKITGDAKISADHQDSLGRKIVLSSEETDKALEDIAILK